MQAALPDRRENGWGRIVNIASTAGLIGYQYVSAYCAAKHGVVGPTRGAALENAQQGVTVYAVCQGYTETDLVVDAGSNIRRKTGMPAEPAHAMLGTRHSHRRLAQQHARPDAVDS